MNVDTNELRRLSQGSHCTRGWYDARFPALLDEIERLRGELDAANEGARNGWRWAEDWFDYGRALPSTEQRWRTEREAERARTGGTP